MFSLLCLHNFTKSSLFHVSVHLLIYGCLKYDLLHSIRVYPLRYMSRTGLFISIYHSYKILVILNYTSNPDNAG